MVISKRSDIRCSALCPLGSSTFFADDVEHLLIEDLAGLRSELGFEITKENTPKNQLRAGALDPRSLTSSILRALGSFIFLLAFKTEFGAQAQPYRRPKNVRHHRQKKVELPKGQRAEHRMFERFEGQ